MLIGMELLSAPAPASGVVAPVQVVIIFCFTATLSTPLLVDFSSQRVSEAM